ncbi:MAG: hypothetical protein ACREBU_13010 [Nitrososphaera sp.]
MFATPRRWSRSGCPSQAADGSCLRGHRHDNNYQVGLLCEYIARFIFKDGVEIILQQLAGYEKPDLYRKRKGGVWDVYLRMQGVRELFQVVSKLGDVTVLEPLRQQPYGEIELVIKDPNGYTLVFAKEV